MIVIDPGHGGKDPGAVGNDIIEKELNLKLSLCQRQRFQELGIPVVMTRDTDEFLSPTERVNRVLSAYGDNPNVLVLSNHINAGGGDGAEVIYALRNDSTLSDLILEEFENSGFPIRYSYQRESTKNPNQDFYFMHRNTGQTQSIIIEHGYLDNASNAEYLKSRIQDMCEAVVRGVARYLGVPYTPPSGSEFTSHTVQIGESLWTIANKYNTTPEAIIAANNLPSDVIYIGQILNIPKSEQQDIIHIVQPGESLWTIANKYNTTPEAIIAANNLPNDVIFPGQRLVIPATRDQNNIYTVQPGDSLWKISRTYNTSVDALIAANNLQTSLLEVGQKLIIPN